MIKDDKSDRENKSNEDDKDDREKIKCISVLMRLVSIRGGSLNSSWTPPSSSRRK